MRTMVSLSFLLSALALAATTVSATRPMNGWVEAPDTPLPSTHTLTFKLKRSTPDTLKRAIDEVSDPASPRFRQYLSNEEIARLVEPVPGAYNAVVEWAKGRYSQGALSVSPSPHGDYVFVEAPPTALGALFDGEVDFVAFKHQESRRTHVGSRHHVEDMVALLPDHIREVVDVVFGANEFFPVVTRRIPDVRTTVGSHFAGDTISPPVLRKRYNVTAAGGISDTQVGIAAFEDAEFRQEDVDTFTSRYSLKDVKIGVVGPNDGGYYGEAGLDTQYIMTAAEGIRTWFLSQEAFDMLGWSMMVMNMSAPPQVLSVSWGSGESGFRPDHMKSANEEFMKMGLKGISLFTASGDDGVGKRGIFKCNDPTWPASSPYITAVGGTILEKDTETGWKSSGGGFSAVFDRPGYQNNAVELYIYSRVPLPNPDTYNREGRVVPDLSSIATNYLVDSFNTQGTLSGTSASTPVVAGMVALINDMRAGRGKGPVGFINPTLYAAYNREGDSFLGYDIIKGDNTLGKCTGFLAIDGFDPITGFGSPTFDKLAHVLDN